jgi:rubrerythrin
VPRALVRLLQGAYSGEKAAALAYRGHARSVARSDQRDAIRRIEEEEWVHRERVGRMLAALGAAPDPLRERALGAVGRALSALCPWCGWTLPMLAAWRLEVANVGEYSAAARLAEAEGRAELGAELRSMAATEREHVDFFASALRRRWSRRLGRWERKGARRVGAPGSEAASPAVPPDRADALARSEPLALP